MATTAPVDFDVNSLRNQVIATYDRVAREPNAHYHFHRAGVSTCLFCLRVLLG